MQAPFFHGKFTQKGGFMKLVIFFSSLILSFSVFSLVKVGEQGACAKLTIIQQNGQEVEKNSCESDQKNSLVLLDFVSATCTYCIASLPEVAAFTNEMRGELTIRQIGIDRNPDLLREYWKEHQANMVFDLALDNARVLKNAYKVTAVPSYVLLDQNKKIIFVNEGTLDQEQFEEIRKLVRSHQ